MLNLYTFISFLAGTVLAFVYFKYFFKREKTTVADQSPLLEKMNQDSPAQEAPQSDQSKTNDKSSKEIIDNLYIVNELGQNITSSLNLDQTITHLYNTINSMMDAVVLELSVNDDKTGSQKIYSNLKTPPDYVNHFAEWSFKNNREVFLSNAEHDYARYVFKPLTIGDERMAISIMIFPVSLVIP